MDDLKLPVNCFGGKHQLEIPLVIPDVASHWDGGLSLGLFLSYCLNYSEVQYRTSENGGRTNLLLRDDHLPTTNAVEMTTEGAVRTIATCGMMVYIVHRFPMHMQCEDTRNGCLILSSFDL